MQQNWLSPRLRRSAARLATMAGSNKYAYVDYEKEKPSGVVVSRTWPVVRIALTDAYLKDNNLPVIGPEERTFRFPLNRCYQAGKIDAAAMTKKIDKECDKRLKELKRRASQRSPADHQDAANGAGEAVLTVLATRYPDPPVHARAHDANLSRSASTGPLARLTTLPHCHLSINPNAARRTTQTRRPERRQLRSPAWRFRRRCVCARGEPPAASTFPPRASARSSPAPRSALPHAESPNLSPDAARRMRAPPLSSRAPTVVRGSGRPV